VEFTIAVIISFIILFIANFDTPLLALETSIRSLFFVFVQIFLRNFLGNYYLSWKLMNYMLNKNFSEPFVSSMNSVCIIIIFIIFKIFFGRNNGFDEVFLTYYVGIPMLLGILFSSIIMVEIINNHNKTPTVK